MGLGIRPCAVAALVAAAVLAGLAAPAGAALPQGKSYAPGKGKAYHGVSDTGKPSEFFEFADQVGAHPATLQAFYHWDTPLTSGAFYRWARTDTRGVLSLSTAAGGGGERITPKQIAKGVGDRYIINLGRTIAEAQQIVYIRLLAEMNGHWNPYSAYNADGSRRSGHSTAWFRRAWRRFALIVRGGSRAKVNRKLVRQKMPRILGAASEDDPVYDAGPDGVPLAVPEQLPQPKVALMWVPQSFGSPNIRGNQPADYWPGGKYVDWVGIDIYSKFAGAFDEGQAFFRRYDKWPFVIGEYGPWDNDFQGAFSSSLFRWARSHNRVKMLLYYRSVTTDNPYNLQFYPGAQRVLRRNLNKRRFVEYAPGVKAVPEPPPPSEPTPAQAGAAARVPGP
ncbi:MAG: hypothetical protein ACRDKX_02430 [Solirubrobacterales bacterium]